ncbi:hypothetical protein TNCT_649291 [Trichonephila clavata]|uniref:Uncharacterized protein n=1 Tax=Trichonephila clavata TaxID=2740835 RepID=A0A8X6LDR2_TRICU|nr:hypothetical protein TNCT_649291 [Trichonephila clavata]
MSAALNNVRSETAAKIVYPKTAKAAEITPSSVYRQHSKILHTVSCYLVVRKVFENLILPPKEVSESPAGTIPPNNL